MKLGDFGTFVIFAAIYTGGSLGFISELPLSLFAYHVKIGEIPTAFVALFGMPAVFGLTLGQFIANLGLESSPLAMITPAVSFIGLLVVYYARKTSTLAGCIAYIAITSLWLSFMLPAVNGTPVVVAAYSAFAGQFVAVIIGYLAYKLVVKRILPQMT
ncbi:MAG: QueT transporter family protein [Candidatus Bathyarchaeia archaeon]